MIIDTSSVLDLLDGNEAPFETGQQLIEAGTPLKVPTMTIVELFVGYGATENEGKARKVENAVEQGTLDSYTILILLRGILSKNSRTQSQYIR